MRLLVTILLIVALIQTLSAQVYPVRVNTNIVPPYSLYLSDYVHPGSNKISVSIFLNDLEETDYKARLKFRIEGVGILITSREGFPAEPLLLNGGIPEILGEVELAPYFDINNLDFQGFSKSDYLREKKLPEGIYQISFEVWDYNRDVRVSNAGSITAWMMLSDPPLLGFPENASLIDPIDPQSIQFQWTPRHTSSPNSAFNASYHFKLVEVWPEGRDPNDAILSTVPLYETNTLSPVLLYSVADPLLIPGRTYAWQVTAEDMGGLDLFRNRGASEVYSFKYGYECPDIAELVIENINTDNASIQWEDQAYATSVTIQYRKAGSDSWFQQESGSNRALLTGLAPSTTYELKLRNVCNFYDGEETRIHTFTTPVSGSDGFSCRIVEVKYPWDEEKIHQLKVGEMIRSGDFEFTLTEVQQNSDGSFSGKGVVPVPYLSMVKLRVEFDRIFVNRSREVFLGMITTTWVDKGLNYSSDPEIPVDDIPEPPNESPDQGISPSNPVVPADSATTVVPPGVGTPDDVETFPADTSVSIVAGPSDGNDSSAPPDSTDTSTSTPENTYAGSTGTQVGTGGSDSESGKGSTGFNKSFSIGPLEVSVAAKPDDVGKGTMSGFRNYSAEASVVWDHGLFEAGTNISLKDALVYFQQHKQREEFSELKLEWEADPVVLAKLDGFEIYLAQARISMGDGEQLLVGSPELSGEATMEARLDKELQITDWLHVRTGLAAELTIDLREPADLKWKSIQNLELSSPWLENLEEYVLVDIDSLGMVNMIVDHPEPIDFQRDGLNYQLFDLKLVASFDLNDPLTTTSIQEGSANLVVAGFEGTDGEIAARILWDELGGMTLEVDQTASLQAFGFDLDSMNLNIQLANDLSFVSARGSATVRHQELDGWLDLSSFEIVGSKLTSFSAEGAASYKGFQVEVFKSSLQDQVLDLSGKISLDINEDAMWVEMQEFIIDQAGAISISEISGELDKKPLELSFSAGFRDQRLFGTFDGHIRSFGLSGGIDIGRKDDYHFAYMELKSQTNIPLAATGLKLTRLGGKIGYNYGLEFKEELTQPVGSPDEGSYVIGLDLGIADMGGTVELSGSSTLSLGDNEALLRLQGQVNIPQMDPVVSSSGLMLYDIISGEIKGDVNTIMQVPAGSGSVFYTASEISFAYQDQQFVASSDLMEGSLFSEVPFTGSMLMNARYSEELEMSGRLTGQSSYDFNYGSKFSAFGADIVAEVNAGFNYNGLVEFDHHRLKGNLDLNVYANGRLAIDHTLITTELSFAGSCQATIRPVDNGHILKGDLDLNVDLQVFEHEINIPIEKSF